MSVLFSECRVVFYHHFVVSIIPKTIAVGLFYKKLKVYVHAQMFVK